MSEWVDQLGLSDIGAYVYFIDHDSVRLDGDYTKEDLLKIIAEMERQADVSDLPS